MVSHYFDYPALEIPLLHHSQTQKVNMKSIFTTLLFYFSILSVYSQNNLVFHAEDMPIPAAPFNYDEITSKKPKNPDLGGVTPWDYSAYFGNSPSTVAYIKEEDPFYLAANIDVYIQNFKNFNAQLGYYTFNELDFNEEGIDDKGVFLDAQQYSLEALTGDVSDNLSIPLQGYLLDQPRRLIQFPMSNNSSWKSTTRKYTDFDITVKAFGLNKVPAKHVYNTFRKDSIVGSGTLRIYTPGGSSLPYEVLLDKAEQYSLDSFYLAGAPAPQALLSGFGVVQGQKSNVANTYNFYRKGTYSYLLRMNYGNDGTFTKLVNAFVNTDNLVTTTTIEAADTYSTLLFPNPSSGKEVKMLMNGRSISSVGYKIIDNNGQTICSASNLPINNNLLTVTTDLQAGNYFLLVFDENSQIIAKEKLTIIN